MKKEIEINDEFTVDFIKNEKGGKSVCRIDGKVAFIDRCVRSFVAPCSTWMVRILTVGEKHCTVEPLIKVRSPKENEELLQAAVEKLKVVPKERKQKIKTTYQYKTFQELKAEGILK